MPNLARIELIGHLGRDPEVKTLQSGQMVARFSLATTRKRKDGDTTSWWKVTAWDKTADVVQRFLRKGSAVYVAGNVQLREWQTEDGKKGKDAEVDVRELVLLGGRQDGQDGHGQHGDHPPASDAGEQPPVEPTQHAWREDVPF